MYILGIANDPKEIRLHLTVLSKQHLYQLCLINTNVSYNATTLNADMQNTFYTMALTQDVSCNADDNI